MLNEKNFYILTLLSSFTDHIFTSNEISKKTGILLDEVNDLILELKINKLIDEKLSITDDGITILEPYKVKNAIIMAAGMSSRFAPLSYEKPKGLLEVKGEILIERQIKQLKEVGIENITIVVGYMKEKMYYLAEKYDVEIIVNSDFYKYNNLSTLKLVVDKLENTYICSSDNYFVKNPFEKYVYNSYYSCVYNEGYTDEYIVEVDKNDKIICAKAGGSDSWIMLGHVYFDRYFSKKFIDILSSEYEKGITKEQLWEELYIRYIDDLDMYIRRYDSNIIKEFDSLEDLRQFDNNYIETTNTKIFKNICKVLECQEKDIKNIVPIKGGLTNLSFKFECNSNEYVYRHPGVGTEDFINRKSEFESINIAKSLKLDNTHIYMDENEGWKISFYKKNSKNLDYNNPFHIEQAMEKLRILHNSNIKTKYKFDIWNEISKFKDNLTKKNKKIFKNFNTIDEKIIRLKTLLEIDNFKETLCHADCYYPNFLIDENGEMHLIDWEYSGVADPACDLGTFIACADYSLEESEEIIEKYLDRKPSIIELSHFIGYVAVMSFYWFLWAINQENNGNAVGEYLYTWYDFSNLYSDRALELYNSR